MTVDTSSAATVPLSRFHVLASSLLLPVVVYDPLTLDLIDVNDAAALQYGYERGELISLRLDDLTCEAMPAIDRTWKHRRRNGDTVYMEILSSIDDLYEGREARTMVLKDVTEQLTAQAALQESEKRFRDLFEHACEGIFQSTVEGGYLRVNPALAHMYGFDSPAEMLANLTDISSSLYTLSGRRQEFLDGVLRDGSITNFESEVYRKDGSTIWISENARCVRDHDGAVLYFEGFVENISQRKAVDAERERLLAEALDRADHDPLTGLLNHRAFHKRLEEEADRAQRNGTTLAVAVLDMDSFKFFNDAYGHAAGDTVLNTVAWTLRSSCRSYDVLARFGGDEFAVLMPDITREAAESFPARARRILERAGYRPPGSDFPIPLGVTAGIAVFPDEAATRHDIVELADRRLRDAKAGMTQDSFGERLRSTYSNSICGFKILDALVTSVDNKDRYTRKHSEEVAFYSVRIARVLGADEDLVERIQVTGLLHDIGKIGVPDAILRKPGGLTDEEYESIRQHPVMGAMIVGATPDLAFTIDGVRHHHERWDGRGYPDGLAGGEIPLIARILAVADGYSAMTTTRPYRTNLSMVTALDILRQGSGTQWDPECIRAFLQVIDGIELDSDQITAG